MADVNWARNESVLVLDPFPPKHCPCNEAPARRGNHRNSDTGLAHWAGGHVGKALARKDTVRYRDKLEDLVVNVQLSIWAAQDHQNALRWHPERMYSLANWKFALRSSNGKKTDKSNDQRQAILCSLRTPPLQYHRNMTVCGAFQSPQCAVFNVHRPT